MKSLSRFFELLLIPILFVRQSWMRRQRIAISIPTTALTILGSMLVLQTYSFGWGGGGGSYSCPGQDVQYVNEATGDAYKQYRENSNHKKRYFKFATKINGSITISFDQTNNLGVDMKIGDRCSDGSINWSGYKTSYSVTLRVKANTTYYIMVQKRNKLKFRIKFDFVADKYSDLSIAGSVSNTEYLIDDIVTYVYTATNHGPETTTIRLTDTLPSGLEFVSVSDDQEGWGADFDCSHSGQTITCDGSQDIYKDDSVQVTIKAKVVGYGDIINTAHVESTDGNVDPNTDDNNASIKIHVEKTSNHRPIAEEATYSVDENQKVVEFNLTGYDPDHDPITYSIVTQPTNGKLTGTPPKMTYTSTGDTMEADSFTFKVTDGELDSRPATIHITPIVNNADDICYEETKTKGFCMGVVNMMCTYTTPITNISDDNVTDVEAVLGTSSMFSVFNDCGIDGKSEKNNKCNSSSGMSMMMFSAFNDGIAYDMPDYGAQDSHTTYNSAMFSFLSSGHDWVASYTKNGKKYVGHMKPCPSPNDGGYRDFTLRRQMVTNGNMVTIGNTILVVPDDGKSCSEYRNGAYKNDTSNTNAGYTLCPYYADNDRPSTSAKAKEGTGENQVRPGSELLWAGLYWQSVVKNSQLSTVKSQIIQLSHSNDGSSNDIHVDTNYIDVHYDTLDYVEDAGEHGYLSYSAFADVTEILKSHNWLSGTYTVANIPTETHKISSLGQYGAWTMVLVYKNKDEKMRTFSIFDGWKKISKENPDVVIPVNGFYTPKQTPINSALSVFAAEGDKNINGDYLEAENANDDNNYKVLSHTTNQTFDSSVSPANMLRKPHPLNNQGIDVQNFQVGTEGANILKPKQTDISFKFTSNQDTYFPSMIAFSTEIYQPKICYDYTYGQDGHFITAESIKPPEINGTFHTSSPLDVKLFLQNKEESDIVLAALKADVLNIDTAQLTYKRDSTDVVKPDGTMEHVADSNVSDDHDADISIGTIHGNEYAYVYYSTDLKSGLVNTPIDVQLRYNLVIDLGNKILNLGKNSMQLKDMEPCQGTHDYNPPKSIFNIVHQSEYKSSLSSKYYYNLPTQVVGRTSDQFRIESMDFPANPDTPIAISTMVAAEMLDVDGFHYARATCLDQSTVAASSKRIWAVFDNAQLVPLDGDDIETAGMFDRAIANAAFRLSYNTDTNDTTIGLIKLTSGKFKFTNFPAIHGDCVAEFTQTHPGAQISDYCRDKGLGAGKGLDKNELRDCMECIYGLNTKRICSRDNFSIRPESFRMSLADDNDSNASTGDIKWIADNSKGTVAEVNLAAGYPYRLDINATRHDSDAPAKGYNAIYDKDDDDRAMGLAWNSAKSAAACNDVSSQNISAVFANGKLSAKISGTNVGQYKLDVNDTSWTRVDWDHTYMAHHTAPYYRLNTSGHMVPDCQTGLHDVAAVDSDKFTKRPGCTITSDHHTNYITGSIFEDVPVRMYPYSFDLSSGLTVGAGPNNNRTFVYMNDLNQSLYPNGVDENMSYNIQGSIGAVDRNGNQLSNFVDGCYADDVNLSLYIAQIADNNTSRLTSDVINYNTASTTSPVVQPRVNHVTPIDATKWSTAESAAYFAKEMNGTINTAIGYNFDRNSSTPVNPIIVEFGSLVAEYKTPVQNLHANLKSNYLIKGSKEINSTVAFVYGRAKPQLAFYDDITDSSVVTPISVEIYCDPSFVGLNGDKCSNLSLLGKPNEEFGWWRARQHNSTMGDGNIVIKNTVTSALSPASGIINISSDGIKSDITVTKPSDASLPTMLSFYLVRYSDTPTPLSYTDRWLVYNPDQANMTKVPFYRVRFVPSGAGWAGHGGTGHVVNGKANQKKSKQIEW